MSKRLIWLAALIFIAMFVVQPGNAYMTSPYTVTPITEDGTVTNAGVKTTTASQIYTNTNATTYRGYIEFNVAAIPDGTVISAVYIRLRTNPSGGRYDIYKIENRPSLYPGATVYADCANGTKYYDGDTVGINLAGNTWYTITLTGAAAELQARLVSNWFGVGFIGGTWTSIGFRSSESAYAPQLIVESNWGTSTYTLNPATTEANVANGTSQVTFISSDETKTLDYTTAKTVKFASRPQYITWTISSGYNRRIYFVADTGTITPYIPEASFAIFSVQVRDFTGITSKEQTYLRTTRAIGGAYQTIEYTPIISTVNGIPVILVAYRAYNLEVDTSGTDYSFSFYSTTSIGTPIIILTPPTYSDVMQFNTRFIHANFTRPTATTIKLSYLDDLANTTLTIINIRTRAGVLVATWNTTLDNFSHTIPGLTNTTDYIAEALINHYEYGNLTYSRVFSGAFSALTAPDLSGLGSFGGIDMTQVMGTGIIILTAALFSSFNAPAGLIVTTLVAAVLTGAGWVNINPGIIVLVLAMALFFMWGRARN